MRALLAILVTLVVATAACAAEWDTIRPGESTQAAVREQFGQPTRVTSQKIEGYDSAQWLYEGTQAPRGMTKMTIDFGLLTPQGYKAEIVRVMQLTPRRGVFTRSQILAGWGEPQGISTDKGVPLIAYRSGLIVTFDPEGLLVTSMTFTPPQTQDAAPAPKRP
jgi:outer membrane protein assembly factor BamE (lipoprotein component of BamABCDE complex)